MHCFRTSVGHQCWSQFRIHPHHSKLMVQPPCPQTANKTYLPDWWAAESASLPHPLNLPLDDNTAASTHTRREVPQNRRFPQEMPLAYRHP
jgi:hypothetical protein